MSKTLLVTGAAGFIGSNFVEVSLKRGYRLIGYDALTYSGHLENISEFNSHPNFVFVKGLIQNQDQVAKILVDEKVDWLVNFAAESHVDRSIHGPAPFIDTNINGTFALLNVAKNYFHSLQGAKREAFRYLQISTDEVFGELGATGKFSEATPYQPNSPYSASKAAGDLLARAWFHTYGLPVIITNCSNNYGPKQFPEKLIPHMIFSALSGKPLPVYGKGQNIRDWIYVQDHALGVLAALERGKVGETYCLGGNSERMNLDVVKTIAGLLDSMKPRADGRSYAEQIEFVTDRPGHDFRYAIDDTKALRELGYTRQFESFEVGLRETVAWYLEHSTWAEQVMNNAGVELKYDWSRLINK